MSIWLQRAENSEQRIYGLLERLASGYALESAVFFLEQAGELGVVGHWGQQLPGDLQPDQMIFRERDATRLQLDAGPALLLPVACAHRQQGCVLLSPWDHDQSIPAEVDLICSILALCLAEDKPRQESETQEIDEITAPTEELESETPVFVAVSEVSLRMLAEIDRLARTDLPVMLHGESGTGKELLALRLHRKSPRKKGRFVAINCAAIPVDLLEAELFGIRAGVATGVSARPGRFEIASGGTLFLDEIGDLPSSLQPKLLRALESGEISPLGSREPLPVDVRLVSASHRDLEECIREGTFRQDLRFRLAGATVRVPALRARPDEVLPLARAFARATAKRRGRTFGGIDLEAARALLGYSWPGNVRQLRNAIDRAMALADGPILHSELLPEEVTAEADGARGDLLLGMTGSFRAAREQFEKMYFAGMVEHAKGNIAEAARRAGMSRSSLYRKLEEHGLR